MEQVWKGEAGKTFPFRQFAWDIRDRHGTLGYRKGQAVVLLMNRPTHLGLSSPAGLDQGRFLVTRGPDGHERAVNGHGNAGLFHRVGLQLEKKGLGLQGPTADLLTKESPGPLRVDDLRNLVILLAGGI